MSPRFTLEYKRRKLGIPLLRKKNEVGVEKLDQQGFARRRCFGFAFCLFDNGDYKALSLFLPDLESAASFLFFPFYAIEQSPVTFIGEIEFSVEFLFQVNLGVADAVGIKRTAPGFQNGFGRPKVVNGPFPGKSMIRAAGSGHYRK